MRSTYAVMMYALLCTVSGEYFDDYCAKPIGATHPGEIQGVLCVVKFPIISNDISRAMSLCEENSPYNVRDAYAEGKQTVCKYERPGLKCNDDEAAIDDRCFIVRGLGPFSNHKDGCGEKYQLHVFTDKNAWLWASVFFSPKGLYLWAAIDNDFAGDMDLVEEPTRRRKKKKQSEQTQEEQEEDWRPVKIQTRTVYPYEAGTLFKADQSQRFPYLCSRPSIYYARGIENLVSDARTLGFNVIEAKDKSGQLRPFLLYDNVFNVKTKSRYEADYSDFKDVCNVFPNGYVASREDFYDQNEYMKIYERARIKMFRTTVARHSSIKQEPSDSCSEDSRMHKMLRKKFQYISPDGKRGEIPDDQWSSGYPMNMCADTPRITAVMTPYGYRDMTAIARLPLICTFGTPPGFKTATDDDICNQAAHYDRNLNRCVCNNASADATVKEPGKWKGYPPGSVCLDCTLIKEQKAVLFVLDSSGSVGSYWETMIAFVRRAFNYLWNSAKVGVVIFDTDARIAIPLDHHTNEELQSVKMEFAHGWTRIDLGMILADQILSKEPDDTVKDVIVISDGDGAGPGLADYWVKNCTDIARKWSNENGKIIYVEVGILSPHVNEILSVSPVHKLIPISNFDALDDIFKDIMKELCTARL